MSTQPRPTAPAQDPRLFAAGLLSTLLLVVAAVGSVAVADDISSAALRKSVVENSATSWGWDSYFLEKLG